MLRPPTDDLLPHAVAPQDLPASTLRALGARFMREFILCGTRTVTEEYCATPASTANHWVARRYGFHQCRRNVYAAPLGIHDMAGILALVQPVAEDILFLGIVTVVRCVVADLRANRAPILPNAVRRVESAASLASHYELCKARMHELDYHLDRRGRQHLTREMRRRAAELLTTYIDMEPIQRAAVCELFYPLARRKTVAPLLLHEVVAIFDEFDIILGSAFTELLFILGCATAVRNVIFRLQARCGFFCFFFLGRWGFGSMPAKII